MKRKRFIGSSLLACLAPLTATSPAWTPSFYQKKDSPFLKHLGFELRSKSDYPDYPDRPVICEALFDEMAWGLLSHARASVVVTAHQGITILFQSDHTLGHFTSYTDPRFGSGKATPSKCFGFRFFISPELIKDAYVLLYMHSSKFPGKFRSGDYVLPLQEFLPDYAGVAKTGSAGQGSPVPPPKTEPPAPSQPSAHKPQD